MNVGSYFKIQPFFGIPALNCRFLRLDDQKNLTLEMGFFPFNKEIVNFNLVPYKNCVEVNYSSRSNGLFSFITIPMFAWLGKDILNNLKNSLPNIKIQINDENSDQDEEFSNNDEDEQNQVFPWSLSSAKYVLTGLNVCL